MLVKCSTSSASGVCARRGLLDVYGNTNKFDAILLLEPAALTLVGVGSSWYEMIDDFFEIAAIGDKPPWDPSFEFDVF